MTTLWLHFISGFVITYFIDWLLKDTPYELDNKDRLVIMTIWPLVFVFLVIMIVKEFIKND